MTPAIIVVLGLGLASLGSDTVPMLPDDLWGRAPYFAALLFIVLAFGYFLEKRDKRSAEALEQRDRELMAYVRERDAVMVGTISTMGSECHVVQDAAIKALQANTEMLGRISGVLLAIETRDDALHNHPPIR